MTAISGQAMAGAKATQVMFSTYVGDVSETLTGLLLMIPYGIIGLLALVAAAWWLNAREGQAATGKNSGQQIKDGNTALGLRRLGMFIAIGIGLSGVYASGSAHLANDLVDSVLYALLLVVMVGIALNLNDMVVLPGVKNSVSVIGGNTAVAMAEVGSMIATGFIAKSAIAGEGGGVGATLVFFVLGQIALLLSVRCYAAFHHRCKIVSQVEEGNLAAGIVLAAKFVAYGLVVSTALAGTFNGWIHGIVSFVLAAAAGVVFLLASDRLVDWVLLRWHTVQELIDTKNTGSALVFAGGQIGMAWVVSTLLL